jgi:fermentation-respiration switch protein FrsA (DUF1100 family)
VSVSRRRILFFALSLVAAGPAPAARAGVITQPTGKFAGRPARGAVMVIHGGAWLWTGPNMVQAVAPRAQRFSDAGYDSLRRQLGKHTPICLWGGSVGGHLALMIAARRPDVACVMSESGPTDLATDTYLLPASNFFFADHGGLARWSPITYADKIRAPLLLVGATNDKLVPLSQARELARARPQHTRVVVLHAGTSPWVHGSERAYAARR